MPTSLSLAIPDTDLVVQEQVSLTEVRATTFRLGGPAEYYVKVTSAVELEAAVRFGVARGWPVTILGGGSNTLISDAGVRGLVIVYSASQFSLGADSNTEIPTVPARHATLDKSYYATDDLLYEDKGPRREITFDAGMTMALAITRSHQQGLTGLCHFGGIPGTLGGALYNNAHGSKKHFSDYLAAAEILEVQGGQVTKKTVSHDYFEFGYDQSRLRRNDPHNFVVVLRVTLSLFQGDVAEAKRFAQTYLRRKKEKQPWNSAGCVFQNLTPEEQAKIGVDSPSWGLVTDKLLGWKGKQVGHAMISPLHASFVVNDEYQATASEVLELMKLIKREFLARYGVSLQPEIKLLGFTPEETAELFAE